MFNLIACIDKNGALGCENELLFHLPEDMKLFKELTLDGIVIMGRNTWCSLPKRFRPLPNRKNIVISSTLKTLPKGSIVAKDIEEVKEIVKDSIDDKWIIGGGKVYNDFLYQGLIEEVYLSEVKATVEKADTFLDIEFIKENYIKILNIDKGEFVYNVYMKKRLP